MSNFLPMSDNKPSLQAPTINSAEIEIPPIHTYTIHKHVVRCFNELLSTQPVILHEVISSQTRKLPLTLTLTEAAPIHEQPTYEYTALVENQNSATSFTFQAEGNSNGSRFLNGEPTLYIGTELLTISRNIQSSDEQPSPSSPSVNSRSQRTLRTSDAQYEIQHHLELNVQTELPEEFANIETLVLHAFRHSLLTITTAENSAKLTFPRQQTIKNALAAIDEHFAILRLAELLPEEVEISQKEGDLVITDALVIEAFRNRIATFIATGEIE